MSAVKLKGGESKKETFILRRLKEGCLEGKKEIGEDYMWVDIGNNLAIKYNDTNIKYNKINKLYSTY